MKQSSPSRVCLSVSSREPVGREETVEDRVPALFPQHRWALLSSSGAHWPGAEVFPGLRWRVGSLGKQVLDFADVGLKLHFPIHFPRLSKTQFQCELISPSLGYAMANNLLMSNVALFVQSLFR